MSAIELGVPTVGELRTVVETLRDWQHPDAPLQLHPGDLGWFWQCGTDAMAAALRTWSRADRIVAIGLQDSATVLRMTTAPDVAHDEALAEQVVADTVDPERGVLPAGAASVEAPNGTRVQDLLLEAGWALGEPWTPLMRDLVAPVPEPQLHVEVIGPSQASAYTAVHRSSFGSPRFTDELWHAMTTGLPYADARGLLGYDDDGVPVAEVTVWSAGPGRPGLLEPMGVHTVHRGRGHGQAICLAAATVLRQLGSSSAVVCTPSANVGGVATYVAAGYEPQPQRLDRTRAA